MIEQLAATTSYRKLFQAPLRFPRYCSIHHLTHFPGPTAKRHKEPSSEKCGALWAAPAASSPRRRGGAAIGGVLLAAAARV